MADYAKPIPIPDQETQPYWDAARRCELQIKQCLDCQRYHFYPRSICPYCHSDRTEWRAVSGRGKVYSYVVNYRPAGPVFQDDVPYVVAIVELDEGARMMSNVVGCDPETVRIDMPVEVLFEQITENISLPKFRLRQS